MKRVLIIGNPGAGKSTLAVQLGEILGLPVIHLDREFWQPGWVMTERDIWREKVSELISKDKWIIDGNFDGTLDIRLPRSDTVIFLDFPTLICLRRITKRIWGSYKTTRPDMAPGCPERIDYSFVRWTWNFRKNIRPRVIECIDKHFSGNELIILKNQSEIDQLFERICKSVQQ